MSLKIKSNKWLIYSILLLVSMGTVSCDCKKPNSNNPSRKSSTPPPPLPNPPTPPHRNDRSTPPKPKDQAEAIQQAIRKLEEEISKPKPDSKLKAVYQVIDLLPPHKAIRNPDGTLSRITEEKNGMELFDKIITQISQISPYSSPAEAVSWLIDQQLLDPNELDNKGDTLLEMVIRACLSPDHISDKALEELNAIYDRLINEGIKLSPEKASDLLEKFIEERYVQADPGEQQQKVLNFLSKKGFSLPPAKASILLERLLEKQLTNNESPLEMLEMVKFLETQGAAIASQPALKLLEKFIQKGAPPQGFYVTEKNKKKLLLYNDLLDLLEKSTQGVAIDQNRATGLLQKAVDEGLGAKLYITLLDLGADPNKIRINYLGEKMPLLHYTARKSYEVDFQELLKKLVDNPQTNINITDEKNRTLSMVDAYNSNSTVSIDMLLERLDLDINTLKYNRSGVKDYTLLDLVVANCMEIPVGHDWQAQQILERNKRWLPTLRKMSLHPNFYVTNDNIQKATENRQRLNKAIQDQYMKKSIEIAQEALDLLLNSPKKIHI